MSNKVEKAVIELDGEWPEKEEAQGVLLFCIKDHSCPGEGVCSRGKYYAGTNLYDRACFEGICTYSEFMETRKRLQNKPAYWKGDYLVQDADGKWKDFRFEEPVVNDHTQRWVSSRGHNEVLTREGRVFGDFRDTLERKVDQGPSCDGSNNDWCSLGKRVYVKDDHTCQQWTIDIIDDDLGVFVSNGCSGEWKCRTQLEPVINTLSNARAPKKGQGLPPLRSNEDEGVKWDGEGLPPVGAEVEFKHGYRGWHGPCRVFHVTKCRLCFVEYEDGEYDCSSDPVKFRPYRPRHSHRDKCIEAAYKAFPETPTHTKKVLEMAYDAGFLHLPNDKEGSDE